MISTYWFIPTVSGTLICPATRGKNGTLRSRYETFDTAAPGHIEEKDIEAAGEAHMAYWGLTPRRGKEKSNDR